ncbi:oxygen-independent coproporphyrinogen III oxidase [Ichthyobacterium seriolicida]|uniref:Coproporphyrinogen-III oxidase n=1 Tax=Ichthyobacterium seriolicida TaxID=242600 RepID=A0A1J1EBM0_9FLAO|nr:oxygen-independent coproporphyrinogen III oxidase [Ichthyobacterium seriolicida]BAV94904.1 oxygen-independent coproporphyrinogen III oxidase [Ichthyobacterium seriolicida]
MDELIKKYNVPGPRYTSYPTVPYWDGENLGVENWTKTLKRAFAESNSEEGISIYIHLPFCESLCSFCGCHKIITKKHDKEDVYIEYLLKEWDLYTKLLEEKPFVKELHIGGGTPTFFSPQNLKGLIEKILFKGSFSERSEFSFECHPNNTSEDHMKVLYDLNFRRISLGVQDYSPVVQKAINRIQPFEKVSQVHNMAREIGYTSISHDLIYGLPHQTLEDIIDTIEKTQKLMPDRIALYGYAHVPWIRGSAQRGFDEKDLPKDEEKRTLYEKSKQKLTDVGYVEIGMDHFSLKSDSLYESFINKKTHRNFMGYSSSKTKVMIGLGVSSISDSWYCFSQNEKKLSLYYSKIDRGILPVMRGHELNDTDLIIRKHILNLMCLLETSWRDDNMKFAELPHVLSLLEEMKTDGLLSFKQEGIEITKKGRPFIRNICMAFDLRLLKDKPSTRIFSMTI